MIDEHFDRGYQEGRAELHDGIDRLVRASALVLTKVRRAFSNSILNRRRKEWHDTADEGST